MVEQDLQKELLGAWAAVFKKNFVDPRLQAIRDRTQQLTEELFGFVGRMEKSVAERIDSEISSEKIDILKPRGGASRLLKTLDVAIRSYDEVRATCLARLKELGLVPTSAVTPLDVYPPEIHDLRKQYENSEIPAREYVKKSAQLLMEKTRKVKISDLEKDSAKKSLIRGYLKEFADESKWQRGSEGRKRVYLPAEVKEEKRKEPQYRLPMDSLKDVISILSLQPQYSDGVPETMIVEELVQRAGYTEENKPPRNFRAVLVRTLRKWHEKYDIEMLTREEGRPLYKPLQK